MPILVYLVWKVVVSMIPLTTTVVTAIAVAIINVSIDNHLEISNPCSVLMFAHSLKLRTSNLQSQ